MELENIIFNHSKELSKLDFFNLLYNLKRSELNFTDINNVYKILCSVYNDNVPIYQCEYYLDSDKYDLNNMIIISDEEKTIINNREVDVDIIHAMINLDWAERSKIIKNIFIEAENNEDKNYVIKFNNLSDIDNVNLFSDLIIPNNIILPIEYVHKTYISDYFYNDKRNEFYKINDNRTQITILYMDENKIESKPYNLMRGKIIDHDTTSTVYGVFVHHFNKLINQINK